MARVAANSYGSGEKYAGINSEGKNEFVRDDGSRYTVGDGIYTSPSGKVSEVSDDGRTTTTLHSRDDGQAGNVYQGGALVGGSGGVSYDDVIALANQMAGNRNGFHRQDIDGYLLRAMAALGYGGSAADFAGDVNLYGTVPQPQADDAEKLESAAAEAARSAYVSRMLRDRDAQQGAAYSGNNRGLRVFDYR